MSKPTHKILTAIEQKGTEKPYWHRVGSAWASDKTIKITLNSFPVNGEMNFFPSPRKSKVKMKPQQIMPKHKKRGLDSDRPGFSPFSACRNQLTFIATDIIMIIVNNPFQETRK